MQRCLLHPRKVLSHFVFTAGNALSPGLISHLLCVSPTPYLEGWLGESHGRQEGKVGKRRRG